MKRGVAAKAASRRDRKAGYDIRSAFSLLEILAPGPAWTVWMVVYTYDNL